MNRPILDAGKMRAAEARAIAAGTPVETLMERAGTALAEAVFQYAGIRPALFLCGPGNNGGDGYVAARHLAAKGVGVRIAAFADPATDAAKWARAQWSGPVEDFADCAPAPLLVDCLFGTGLTRGLADNVADRLSKLAEATRVRIACDLPSGVSTDDGEILSDIPNFDLTVTFGALKPAHRLMPAMKAMGRLVLADIGIEAVGDWFEIGKPDLPEVAANAHKYSRGLVHCLAGEMAGAIGLTATAAARAGAGYVRLSTSSPIAGLSMCIVQTGTGTLSDPRIGCIAVGPGMGDLPQILTLALTSHAPKVIDADAIRHVGDPERLNGHDAILTPHEGEFEALFGTMKGSKPERALAAAKACDNVVVFKGPDTVVAAPDGRVGFAPAAPAWLASAGTGDVLTGIIAAFRARGMPSFEAACAGVWIHGRAAEAAGPAMIADDLVAALRQVLA
ncbi:NAD(P)H-hydrate dehydratase [Sphingomonas sp. HDW15A]|uniref:NAD(P)H-hydrate dehydratase n=1 Tax=Sphingomonas sp. HDW15A TaxID=2714942 RepID=UPI0014075984|nr:NAD(P)H-hydrate dehydratase [Sphingomonas sp. HDW15A]QIK96091.1 NAD(P)H-hydrate dehydratase [Sphingomonas sp. HDW15A]